MLNINYSSKDLLANNIVYFRHKNGWSQEELAEKMNSSPVYISQLENAKRNVRCDFLDKIAETFDVEPCELLVKREQIMNKRIDRKR